MRVPAPWNPHAPADDMLSVTMNVAPVPTYEYVAVRVRPVAKPVHGPETRNRAVHELAEAEMRSHDVASQPGVEQRPAGTPGSNPSEPIVEVVSGVGQETALPGSGVHVMR